VGENGKLIKRQVNSSFLKYYLNENSADKILKVFYGASRKQTSLLFTKCFGNQKKKRKLNFKRQVFNPFYSF